MISTNAKKVRALVKAELSSLWRFALHITHDKTDAEDLVQRTCLRALERSDTYRDMQRPQSWLFRIAQNIWKNELRSRNLRNSQSIDPHSASEPYNASFQQTDRHTPDRHLEFRQVVTAIDELPEAQRLVMLLVAVDGFSYAETASILEVPIGTVMSRLARARLAIGRQFKQQQTVDQPGII